MSSKRPLDDVGSQSETKKAKDLNSKNCINEKLEKEMKLLKVRFPIDLQDIKEKKILHKASEKGYIHALQELLKHGANVNQYDSYYGTPINVAALNGNLPLVKELLKLGADPYQELKDENDDYYMGERTPIQEAYANDHQSIVEEMLLHGDIDVIVNEYNETSLHYAADCGNTEVIKKLLEKGCKVNVKNKENDTPLHSAIEKACLNENYDSIRLLLKYGANVNAKDFYGDSVLHKAVKLHAMILGNAKNMALHTILEKGTNLNFDLINIDSKTALQVAIDNKYVDSARMLELAEEMQFLEISFPMNLKEIKKKKILQIASLHGCLKVVKEILKHRVDINDNSYYQSTALHIASRNGDEKIVAELLAHGAKIELRNGESCFHQEDGIECDSGTTALHMACHEGHIEVVKEILKFAPNLSQVDDGHYNALQLACSSKHLDIVKELISNGANANETFTNDDYDKPIYIAASEECGDVEIFKELMKHGANPFQLQKINGFLVKRSAIKEANENGHFEIVEAALLNGDIDAIHDGGMTKLHHASYIANISIVTKLLEKGCKVDVQTDYFKDSALHLAIDSGNKHSKEIVSKLLLHGANPNLQDRLGRTAVHLAVENLLLNEDSQSFQLFASILQTLLKEAKTTDFSLMDKNGKTALQRAIKKSATNHYFAEVAGMIKSFTS